MRYSCLKITIVLTLGPMGLVAQDVDSLPPEVVAAARRLIQAIDAPALMITGMEASIPIQKASAPEIPEEFWDEMLEKAKAQVPEFVEKLVPVYAKHFSLDQIEALIEFYESPLGRHLVSVQPQVTRESMALGEVWGVELGAAVAVDLARRGIIIR